MPGLVCLFEIILIFQSFFSLLEIMYYVILAKILKEKQILTINCLLQFCNNYYIKDYFACQNQSNWDLLLLILLLIICYEIKNQILENLH